MKSVIRDCLAVAGAFAAILAAAACNVERSGNLEEPARAKDTMRIAVLRKAAIEAGFVRSSDLAVPVQQARVAVGRQIFESPLMSINGSISCRDCHLDEFGSADGLPNAVGVDGVGKGAARMASAGRILPRNTLAFWGRGGKGFDTFFWDGKVSTEAGKVISQYGAFAPSSDPLVVAVHLPSVELREMVSDTPEVRDSLVAEDVSDARSIQQDLARRFAGDSAIGPAMSAAYGLPPNKITFLNVADAIANFIRDEFRIRPTKFERFVFLNGPINEDELAGGILFYGRGRCSQCHGGPYFSDLQFHAVAFPQAGFGKNGFGIDEGRYNVTLDPSDRFKFRTPPLFNVEKTSPYSHSGSVTRLEDAIVAHFDPLRLHDIPGMDVRERSNLYARLGPAALEPLPSALDDQEVRQIADFLRMLSFETDQPEPQ